jgi:FG-GAP repeat
MVASFKKGTKVTRNSELRSLNKKEAKVIKLIFAFFSISLLLFGGNTFTTSYSQPRQVPLQANQQPRQQEQQEHLEYNLQQLEQQQQVRLMAEEVSSNYENSSSIGSSNANASGIVKKNDTQLFNQDNRSNMTGGSESNNTIDFFQAKNETRISTNTTLSNITSGFFLLTAQGSKTTGDFNGDGFEDNAIGVPNEDLDTPTGTLADAGVVQVIYGSSGGLSTSSVLADQLLKQDSLDNGGIPENDDHFGFSVSSGDYNGDGFDDLAIGVPGEDIDLAVATIGNFDKSINSAQLRQDVGVVQVIYGSGGGLSSAVLDNQVKVFIQGFYYLSNEPETADGFGSSLTSGNFNGDKNNINGRDIDDLAIGTPLEDIVPVGHGNERDAGVVQVVYGSQLVGLNTLQAEHNQAFWQEQAYTHIADLAEEGDNFGWSLSAGDYNGDGFDDLSIGVPGEERHPGSYSEGAVNRIYGSSSGLSPTNNQIWQQGFVSLADVPEAGDYFGYSLSSGDFNGDGRDDLAVGVPGENIGAGETDEGEVNIIYSVLVNPVHQLWQQGLNGLDDVSEAGDGFGWSISSGDFNGDGKDDLVIGVPDESVSGGTIAFAGKVHVIYGSLSGLSTTSPLADQLWEQGLNGLDDVSEAGDGFGWSISSGDFNGDHKDDLVIGVPFESVQGGTIGTAGKVHTIYGSSSGLSATSPPSPIEDQLWEQGLDGLNDVAEDGDLFGVTP